MKPTRFLATCLVLLTSAVPAAWADYADEVLADGPVGYWRLDETTGTLATDLSENGNDGTYSGVVLGVDGGGCDTAGGATTFDGDQDRVTVNDDASLNIPHVTMEAWVLWCGDNGFQQRIMEKSYHGPTLSEYGLSVKSTGRVFVEIATVDGGLFTVGSVAALVPSEWTHVAGTYDGSEISIYIDGVLDHVESAVGGVLDNNNKPLGIGNQANRDRPWNGTLDEAAIYPYALDSARIEAHFEACSPPSVPSCPLYPVRKMYWTDYGTAKIQRADPDGSNVEDLVGNGLVTPLGIAIDGGGGKIYWADAGTDKIQRANLDGSNIEDLIATGLVIPDGIALDALGGKIYWADRGTDKIQRANLDGTGVEDLVVTGMTSVSGIVLDLVNGQMYWADGGIDDQIQRADLDGTNVETLVTETTNPTGLTLDLGSGKMLWTETGAVRRANLDGTGIEDLVVGLGLPRFLTLETGRIYWADSATGKLQRSEPDGSDVVDLVAGLTNPYGITFGPGEMVSSGIEVGTELTESGGVRIESSFPNPFRVRSTLTYDLSETRVVSLRVHDASGRVVRRLLDRDVVDAGARSVDWDGRNERGELVPSGVYFYRMSVGSSVHSHPTLVIR